MYVVLRRADVGDVDILATFEDELDAAELAVLANVRDNGPNFDPDDPHNAYVSFVEFAPLSDDPRKTFRDIFDEEPPASD